MFVIRLFQTRFIMKFLQLLLCAGLIFITTIVFCVNEDTENNSSETANYCLSNNIIPMHYNINIMPNIEEANFSFYGESYISIKICNTLLNISLHSLELEINGTATTLIDDNGIIYKSISHIHQQHIMVLTFDNKLLPGLYTLYIKYTGGPAKKGKDEHFRILYTDEEGYRAWFAIKPFATIAVRQNSQYYDDPVLNPTFDISVKHNQKYKALSNMPLQEQYMNEDDMIWSRFNTTPQTSSCLVTVVVLNFDRVSNANETVNIWCRSNLTSKVKFAQSIAEKVAQHMVRYTNISEKIPKMDHIAMPNFLLHGLANWGVIIYNEEDIIYDTDIHPTYRKRYIAKLIAHEVVHHWFGNLVVPSWWFHSWLSEGFASFLQAYILNEIFENWRMMDFLVIENLQGALRMDTGSLMDFLTSGHNSPPDINIPISSAFYDKAPAILRMLQHIITDEVFRKGAIIYLCTHQFKSASSDDLWIAMQTALDESNIPYRNFKIKEVMDPWINQRHYPLVTVTRNYETNETIISQKRFYLRHIKEHDVIDNIKWWIPVTFTTQTSPNFINTLPKHWLSPLNGSISLDINPNDWIIINLQQTGYYRVNYDPMNWRRIANYLNSEEYTKIHVLNRAQLIDDAFSFLIQRQLDFSIFLNLTNYLSRETDYVAWYPMFQILLRLSKFFPLPESEIIKSQMVGIFNGLLENVGYEEDPNEDDLMTLKRQFTLYWACILGNLICKRMATIKLDKYLADPDNNTLSPQWHKWTYCSGLMTANVTIWNKVMSLYARKHAKTFLEYLACSEDSNIIINYLNIISSNDTIMKKTERYFAFSYIVKKHARNDLVLDYILENFEKVKPKLITTDDALKNIISNVFSKMQVDKVREFVKNNVNEETSDAIQPLIENRLIRLKIFIDNFLERFISRENEI